MFNSFHILACVSTIILFILICVVIFVKIKKFENALAFYFINIVFTGILTYSLFLSIEQYTKQASISNVKFARNLRTESVTITGRVTNDTKFPINKCFLELTITNKVGSEGTVFNQSNKKNVQRGSNSVNYNVLVITSLPGNSHKDFSVQVPFPPKYINVEFYYILNCI